MGNSATSHQSGKVILSDGAVFNYSQPLTVAELMLEHPQEVVIELHSVLNGEKTTPLPADKKLEMKKLYLMRPIKKGKPVKLSSEEARQLLARTNALLNSKALLSYTGFLPLFVRTCPAVGRRGAHTPIDTKKSRLVERKVEDVVEDYFKVALEARPEFLSRQISGKGWRPSLDTIKEKKNIKARLLF